MGQFRQGIVCFWGSLLALSFAGCSEQPTPSSRESAPVAVNGAESPSHALADRSSESRRLSSSTDTSSHQARRDAQVQSAALVSEDRRSDSEPSQTIVASALETPADNGSSEKKSLIAPRPFFTGWTNPAAVLVFSGEQHGHLEPCGCSENQSGGISRRHDLIKQIEAKGWPLTSMDLGGTVNRSRAQTKLKFQTFLAAMKDMRYSVLNLGPEELKLGAADLLAAHTPDEKNPLGSLGFLSANVTLFGSPDLGTPMRSKVLTLGQTKIGVTSILGSSFRKEVAPEGASSDITVDEPATALPAVLKSLQAQKPDLLVLLSHGTFADAKDLAGAFPEFDVILTAGGVEDPEANNPQKVGKSLVVQVGRKGKYTGVLGFFPQDSQNRLRYELIKLVPDRFQDSDKMIGHMRFYQELLKNEQLAEKEPPIKHPSGARFVGTKACAECHTKAFDVWKETGHAKAYESLIEGRPELKGRWVSRIHDPECLSCHVTGWHPQDALRYASGFESKDKTPQHLGNGCENCHGPGSRHIQLVDSGDLPAARKEMRVTLDEARKTLCYSCHDNDNDPKFGSKTFDSYWEKIKHKGLD